jgi:4-hydroxy-3-methylbut-2-enyl diphosphate reductase IspH
MEIVNENEHQVNKLPPKKGRAVLARSTQDLYLSNTVVAALIERTEELNVYNTICLSTQTRQKFTSEPASRVDTRFITGGKKSSNIKKLYQISKKILARTYFIEKADQISPAMVGESTNIDLSGGASTPPGAIQEALAKIITSHKLHYLSEKRVQCQS